MHQLPSVNEQCNAGVVWSLEVGRCHGIIPPTINKNIGYGLGHLLVQSRCRLLPPIACYYTVVTRLFEDVGKSSQQWHRLVNESLKNAVLLPTFLVRLATLRWISPRPVLAYYLIQASMGHSTCLERNSGQGIDFNWHLCTHYNNRHGWNNF